MNESIQTLFEKLLVPTKSTLGGKTVLNDSAWPSLVQISRDYTAPALDLIFA